MLCFSFLYNVNFDRPVNIYRATEVNTDFNLRLTFVKMLISVPNVNGKPTRERNSF